MSRTLALSEPRAPMVRTWIVAVGKAAAPMATAAVEMLGDAVRGGVVIVPTSAPPIPRLEMIVGEHPEPGSGSHRAGQRALAVASSVGEDEQLLVLLSGGASALMAAPAPGITLADKTQTTRGLLRAGADIRILNTVRKHLSEVKGGWLAVHCAGTVRTLALSDVVGDDLSVIGSGPTVADVSTFTDARQALDRFSGHAAFPPAVWHRIDQGISGLVPETPKPGDARLGRSAADVIGGRGHAMRGAGERAAALGYTVVTIDAAVVGEARDAAHRHLKAVMARADGLPHPLCVVSSGETIVTVNGTGRGGRNQEFALALVEPLAELESALIVASFGTDGVDGPTDAAGAMVDPTTRERAVADRLAPAGSFLARNDAYHFFAPLGDLIMTGPTGTNVGDLQVILLA